MWRSVSFWRGNFGKLYVRFAAIWRYHEEYEPLYNKFFHVEKSNSYSSRTIALFIEGLNIFFSKRKNSHPSFILRPRLGVVARPRDVSWSSNFRLLFCHVPSSSRVFVFARLFFASCSLSTADHLSLQTLFIAFSRAEEENSSSISRGTFSAG